MKKDKTASLTGKVAIITGASNGIGRAIAERVAQEGATVVVNYGKSADKAKDVVAGIEANGGKALAIQADMSRVADVGRLVKDTVKTFGRLDILVNNAGAPHGDDRGDIEDVTLAAWERVMAVNVRGVFLMSRAAVGAMRARRWGRIVNIASAIVRHAIPRRTAYTTSKAAVVGFTQSLALDVAPWGITVNAVCPGSIRTARAISSTRKAGWDDIEEGLRERAKGIPVGRHGEADEVAAAVAYLASDASAYVTGTSVFVDGGGLPR